MAISDNSSSDSDNNIIQDKTNGNAESEIANKDVFKDCITFINKVESKNEIYLFKSPDVVNAVIEMLKNERSYLYKNEIQLVLANNKNADDFIKAVYDLTKLYKQVVFVYPDFSETEIAEYCLKMDDVHIYQTRNNVLNGSNNENLFSKITKDIKDKEYLVGETYNIHKDYKDHFYGKVFTYKNHVIMVWAKAQGRYDTRTCIRILSNYTFEITQININIDKNVLEEKEVELKITDYKNDSYVINISAKDLYNLSSFRKILHSKGNLIDNFSRLEFQELINQSYEKAKANTVHIYKTPGLIKDRNVWLYADEVIKLED